tara:strand:- start:195 stop:449 length:255 start_codon:yes stop_codon:yes gene_type:complete
MYSNYKKVYYNEVSQKVWRTNTTAIEQSVNYEYIGTMTLAEYDLLIETLFELYEDNEISLEAFIRIFGDIRTFSDHIKKLVDNA